MNDALLLAIRQAQRSAETFRHGAVLLEGRSVVATGYNRNINACGLNSIHAEMDALWKVRHRSNNFHIVVVRLRRDQEFGYSRPCRQCARVLLKLGVKRMTYTTGDPARPVVTEPLNDQSPVVTAPQTLRDSTPRSPVPACPLVFPVSGARICCTPVC